MMMISKSEDKPSLELQYEDDGGIQEDPAARSQRGIEVWEIEGGKKMIFFPCERMPSHVDRDVPGRAVGVVLSILASFRPLRTRDSIA
jgi:hypothetical protein